MAGHLAWLAVLLPIVKIKIVITLVNTSGDISFDCTEKSQYFIGKHVRNVYSQGTFLNGKHT